MLCPNDRHHLFDLLRPPEGYDLNYAVGTTYSLDLTTLLTVPVGFAYLDYDGSGDNDIPDPLLILDSIHQFSQKIAVFCQAGQIYVPRFHHSILNAYLENAVFPVRAPNGGVFHAKVWLLRFTFQEKDIPIKYRLLCMSRNITFDKSWDTVVALDGEWEKRKNAYAANRPLSDFIAKLPVFSIQKVPSQITKIIKTISNEILTTKFDPPHDREEACFDELKFWPMGLERKRDIKKKGKMFTWPIKAVISPFINNEFVKRFLKGRQDHPVLISRSESLDTLKLENLGTFNCVYTLADGASQEPLEENSEQQSQPELSGLHAKIFIMESGWKASIFTGSANATLAAFTKNVEFMIELVGKKSRFGVDQFLRKIKGEANFFDMLVPYAAQNEQIGDDQEKCLEVKLDNFCLSFATTIWNGVVTASQDKSKFNLTVFCNDMPQFQTDISTTVKCRPITLRETHLTEIRPETTQIVWKNIDTERLTAFIAFRVDMASEHVSKAREFVIKIILKGAPEDRLSRIMGSMLSNPKELMKFLMIILNIDSPQNPIGWTRASGLHRNPCLSIGPGVTNGLLEMLLTAVSRDPKRIDRIAEVVEDLQKAKKGGDILLDEFEQIWHPICEARGRKQDA